MSEPWRRTTPRRDMNYVLAPMVEALKEYRYAFPMYVAGMRAKFPYQPTPHLDDEVIRKRENLLAAARELEKKERKDIVWPWDEGQPVETKVLFKRKKSKSPLRDLMQRVKKTKEGMLVTDRIVREERKEMDRLRSEMHTINAWLDTGGLPPKELLRTYGLMEKYCSLVGEHSFKKTPNDKEMVRSKSSVRSKRLWKPERSASPRSGSSQSSASSRSSAMASCRYSTSSRSSAPSRYSTLASPLRTSAKDGVVTSRGASIIIKPSSQATPNKKWPVTFKTRRVPKLARALRHAKYCPVGNEISFRKKGGPNAEQKLSIDGNAGTCPNSGTIRKNTERGPEVKQQVMPLNVKVRTAGETSCKKPSGTGKSSTASATRGARMNTKSVTGTRQLTDPLPGGTIRKNTEKGPEAKPQVTPLNQTPGETSCKKPSGTGKSSTASATRGARMNTKSVTGTQQLTDPLPGGTIRKNTEKGPEVKPQMTPLNQTPGGTSCKKPSGTGKSSTASATRGARMNTKSFAGTRQLTDPVAMSSVASEGRPTWRKLPTIREDVHQFIATRTRQRPPWRMA